MGSWTYTVGMLSIVILSTIALIFILKKNNLLNISMVSAIALSSITICLVIPLVFSGLSQSGLSLIPSILAALLIYITLVFIITVAISSFIPEKKAMELWGNVKKSRFAQLFGEAFGKIAGTFKSKHNGLDSSDSREIALSEVNTDDAYNSYSGIVETAEETVEETGMVESVSAPEDVQVTEVIKNVEADMHYDDEQLGNISEKSVDTEQIIDKMGIENINEDILGTSILSESDEIRQESMQDDHDIMTRSTDLQEDIEVEEPETVDITEEEYITDINNEDNPSDIEDAAEGSYLLQGNETSQFLPEESISDEVAADKETALSIEEVNINDSISGETCSLLIGQSVGNIDNVQDSGIIDQDWNVDDYINEAFRLKEDGDKEGAILYYMYALDKNPEKDVVFWIALDTCVLYKEMGQVELAKEILESYVAGFGEVMSPALKIEIERNL